jgi:DNA-binding NtrC family response regulator
LGKCALLQKKQPALNQNNNKKISPWHGFSIYHTKQTNKAMKTSTTKSANILLVEDNVMYAEALKSQLLTFCTSVKHFTSGEECLKSLDEKPDMVILDHHLEGELTGIDVLKAIKMVYPDTDVLYISGNDDSRVAFESFKKGAEKFVVKKDADLNFFKRGLVNVFRKKAEKAEKAEINLSKALSLITISLLAALVIALHITSPDLF